MTFLQSLTVFRAAPILKLSATHHKVMPFLNARFFLILPTKTGSTPDASRVVGYSKLSGLSITFIPKEFFKISLDELEALVEKYDPTAEFNRTMVAEQYHQSLSMAEENRAS